MEKLRLLFPVFLMLAMALVLSSCDRGGPGIPDNICGQEPCYEGPFEPPWISAHDYGLTFTDQYRRELPCDNRVLETENVLTFSDASSDEVKIEYARMTEESLAEIMAFFNISDTRELGIIDLTTKFRIYSDRYYNYDQAALPNGFLLMGLDNPVWGDRPVNDPEFFPWFRREVKHETTHVVQYCLGGIYSRVHFWFTEGVAEYVSGGVYLPYTCWPEVEEWRNDHDNVNPISIREKSDHPAAASGSFYRMYHLAVQYLLNPGGRGRTADDLKAMFADIGSGIQFAGAFELHMGLSLEEYQANFWEWMEAYLPATCD
jgi:hypothetical protein